VRLPHLEQWLRDFGPLLLASRGAAFFGTLAVAMLVVVGALFAVRHRVNRRAAALATGT
jgi:uncharacterized membrane protein